MEAVKARLTSKEAIAELIRRRNELLKRNSEGLEGTLLRLKDGLVGGGSDSLHQFTACVCSHGGKPWVSISPRQLLGPSTAGHYPH